MPNSAVKPQSPVPTAIRIGQLAELSGRSVHALRYYETLGLLPFVSRDAQGRRSYRPQHVQWLAFLDRLQRTGMSLARMREYAGLVTHGRQTIPQRLDLLKAHLAVLERELDDIRLSQRILKEKIAFYQAWHATGQRPREIWAESLATAQEGKTAAAVRRRRIA